jgi:hypothetical protein
LFSSRVEVMAWVWSVFVLRLLWLVVFRLLWWCCGLPAVRLSRSMLWSIFWLALVLMFWLVLCSASALGLWPTFGLALIFMLGLVIFAASKIDAMACLLFSSCVAVAAFCLALMFMLWLVLFPASKSMLWLAFVQLSCKGGDLPPAQLPC